VSHCKCRGQCRPATPRPRHQQRQPTSHSCNWQWGMPSACTLTSMDRNTTSCCCIESDLSRLRLQDFDPFINSVTKHGSMSDKTYSCLLVSYWYCAKSHHQPIRCYRFYSRLVPNFAYFPAAKNGEGQPNVVITLGISLLLNKMKNHHETYSHRFYCIEQATKLNLNTLVDRLYQQLLFALQWNWLHT